ncbi:MAG: hypothetical protein ACREAZ_01175 [Nitrososphaera sp.]
MVRGKRLQSKLGERALAAPQAITLNCSWHITTPAPLGEGVISRGIRVNYEKLGRKMIVISAVVVRMTSDLKYVRVMNTKLNKLTMFQYNTQ